MNFAQFLATHTWILILAAIWTIPWKGVALWRAARNRSVAWFVVLLIVNTLGILEIIYIFAFSKKTEEEEAPQPIEEQEIPEPEKIVLDIKGEEKAEEKTEAKEEKERKEEEKSDLDEETSKG
ncbi:MAG: DUF5652 family protein [Candidatus Moranbacteria bacterium]|nr:DUF5652 family protein [Candidatus Moranbacteria bacterium]